MLYEGNYEYDFGATFESGRLAIFNVADVISDSAAREKILNYMDKNVDDFDEDLFSITKLNDNDIVDL